MYSDILNSIGTKKELMDFVSVLKDSLAEIDSTGSNLSAVMDKNLDSEVSRLIQKDLLNTPQNGEGEKDPVEKLRMMISALEKIEEVKLTLSFFPKKTDLTEIIGWIKNNVGSDVVAEILVDRTIVGGVIISYKGHYKDYSLGKLLN